jgi:hypothetical protein
MDKINSFKLKLTLEILSQLHSMLNGVYLEVGQELLISEEVNIIAICLLPMKEAAMYWLCMYMIGIELEHLDAPMLFKSKKCTTGL